MKLEICRDDTKHFTQLFFLDEFGVDLRDQPSIWEKIYDVFVKYKAQGVKVDQVIRNMANRGEINTLPEMAAAKEILPLIKKL